MKKLLGIIALGLLWCNVGFAEIELNCKIDVHVKSYSQLGATKNETTIYDKWGDLDPYKIKQKIRDDKVFTKTDAQAKVGLEGNIYETIINDRRYIVGKIIKRDSDGIVVDHLIYDKKYKFLSMLYYSEYGITIYDGYCN